METTGTTHTKVWFNEAGQNVKSKHEEAKNMTEVKSESTIEEGFKLANKYIRRLEEGVVIKTKFFKTPVYAQYNSVTVGYVSNPQRVENEMVLTESDRYTMDAITEFRRVYSNVKYAVDHNSVDIPVYLLRPETVKKNWEDIFSCDKTIKLSEVAREF